MKPQYGDVSVALDGHVAVVEVNRPPNNHVSAGMMRDLADAFLERGGRRIVTGARCD